jgi:hypothetical protein
LRDGFMAPGGCHVRNPRKAPEQSGELEPYRLARLLRTMRKWYRS